MYELTSSGLYWVMCSSIISLCLKVLRSLEYFANHFCQGIFDVDCVRKNLNSWPKQLLVMYNLSIVERVDVTIWGKIATIVAMLLYETLNNGLQLRFHVFKCDMNVYVIAWCKTYCFHCCWEVSRCEHAHVDCRWLRAECEWLPWGGCAWLSSGC